MEVAIITLICCVLIYSVANGIQMNCIEDKIDELKKEIKALENKKD